MSLRIYNTLSRQTEEFVPLQTPQVRLYTCGPTVYDFATIGNFRAYVFEDLLRRTLRFRGFQVIQVMNLTDVDDKTIRGAQAAKVALGDYTRQYTNAFFEDLRTLAIEPAEHYPAATAHIPEMIALIEILFQKGYAYRSEDGSVYFSIAKFKDYGKLAHLDLTGLKPGARIAQDEYQKENAADFALWKAWQSEDGDVAWDSPWGRGRPGWHIECSAMSMKYLGASFDLHTGGVDNIFPHHEDEIAQSEAATGRPFVKYWMHCAHLVVDGRKMSKSLGNFFTVRDILRRGYSGREIRYALMAVHYRQALNFTFEALDADCGALARLDAFSERLLAHNDQKSAVSGQRSEDGGQQSKIENQKSKMSALPAWMGAYLAAFTRALDDDLNISLALAALFDFVHEGNKRLDEGALSPAEAAQALDTLAHIDGVLGVRPGDTLIPPAAVVQLAQARLQARQRKDWAEADRLRREVEAQGWIIQDAPDGFRVKRNSDPRVNAQIGNG
ncbi:MAG: cysteine--tRNA ligase [Kiritimatiellae bacterium]|nr:cysteine--tRNA ligase [Kiritimatiellia bacterium]